VKLFAGDELIGYLYPTGPDVSPTNIEPFTFEPTPAFDKYRALFERQNELPGAVLAARSRNPFRRKEAELARSIDALDLRMDWGVGGRTKIVTILINGNEAAWRPAFCRIGDEA
jgi:hypothetical protein